MLGSVCKHTFKCVLQEHLGPYTDFPEWRQGSSQKQAVEDEVARRRTESLLDLPEVESTHLLALTDTGRFS